MDTISLVIPIHNEALNLQSLLTLIHGVFGEKQIARRSRTITYEIIIVTDNPDNQTIQNIQTMSQDGAIRVYIVDGTHKKSDLCEIGFAYAKYTVLAKIDPDVQYYPGILSIIAGKISGKSDVFAAFEIERTEVLIFTKRVWETIHFTPLSYQTFNMEFLHRATEAGFAIKQVPVTTNQEHKIFHFADFGGYIYTRLLNLFMKIKKVHPQYMPSVNKHSMISAGFGYKKQHYITHTNLQYRESAIESFMLKQLLTYGLFFECIGFGLLLHPLLTLKIIVATLSIIYFLDILFTLYLVFKTFRTSHEIGFTKRELKQIQKKILPIYSILCPLYKEAHVLQSFLEGIARLDWPKEKLDVLLLLEEDDTESIEKIQCMHLPSYVQTVIVPQSFPKTKPKACNYGLAYAKGVYIVIYDAEDIPDPLQLKKAYAGFKKLPRNIVCLQAKLNYYNPNQNLLTRFFTAEYSLWFDITLIGLQSMNTIIPLGGTSNHFRTQDLKNLSAWDPFNVTEDADLGMRLFKQGYQTAIIDSITFEEANSNVGNWIRQRSRWIKGYMQTYLVHTRNLTPLIRKKGIHAFIFHLVIGGKIAFIFINPLLWLITISYFTLYSIVGPVIEKVYPPAILYIAIISLIFGNYLYLFCYILACVKKEQWGLIKYVFLIPFYWLLMSVAGCIAFYQLLFKPHYWEKTVHGLHGKTYLPGKRKFSFSFLPKFSFGQLFVNS